MITTSPTLLLCCVALAAPLAAQRQDTWFSSFATQSNLMIAAHMARTGSSSSVTTLLADTNGTMTMSWNGSALSQVPTLVNPPSRVIGAMATINTGATDGVLLFGGQSGNQYLGDTWLLTGSTWTNLVGAGPQARSWVAMATATGPGANGQPVLFGGVDFAGVEFGDTWTHDGANWIQLGGPAPAPRQGAAMCSDGAGGLLLFGGNQAGVPLDELWRFAGGTWTQLASGNGPGPRTYHAMTFDAARGEVVVIGGWDGSSNRLTDVWTLNPTNLLWTLRSPVAPLTAPGLGFAYACAHPGTGELVYSEIDTNFHLSLYSVVTSLVTAVQPAPCARLNIGMNPVTNPPRLSSASGTITVSTGGPLPNVAELLLIGFGSLPTPIPVGAGCVQHMATPVAVLFGVANATGTLAFTLAIGTNPALIGLGIEYQAAAVDPAGAIVLGSDLLTVTFGR